MSKDIFHLREMYLEEEYFRKKDFELLEKLKAVFQKDFDKESIRKATGVTNEELLDRMASLHVGGEAMAAFQLYPLVEIAWANGDLSESEVTAVLDAGRRQGLRPGTKAYQMLEERLRRGPDREVRKIWFLYAQEIKKVLSPRELETFRNDLLDRARAVIAATGEPHRILVNVGEREVLTAIEKALSR